MKSEPLFPMPERDMPRLSNQFNTAGHRLRRGQKAKWTARNAKTYRDCDECISLQYETAGDYGPRRQARSRRTAGTTRLDLCGAHATAWKDRDIEDGG